MRCAWVVRDRFLRRTGMRATRAPSRLASPGRNREVFHSPEPVPGGVLVSVLALIPGLLPRFISRGLYM